MQIHAIRHLRVALPPDVCYGHSDVSLKEPFVEEWDRIAQKLPIYHSSLRVYSSPLKRCSTMASHIYPMSCLDQRLEELHFGVWELLSWDEIYKDPRSQAFFADYLTTPTPCGESNRDLIRRVSLWLCEVLHDRTEEVVLFTHGGVIRALEVLISGKSLEESFQMPVPYGHIITFEI